MKKTIFTILTLTLLFLAGCGEENVIPKPNTVYDTHECTAEQKQAEICTMDYTPTCGDDQVTYGNACSACASENIDYYTMGECVDQELLNQAQEYCESDTDVFICSDYIQTRRHAPGAGSVYYYTDGTELHCPVVAPEAVSEGCKSITTSEECTTVCLSEIY